MFAGGTESAINPIGVAGFSALKALSTRNDSPETASRPFDATRDGFIISEGSAMLVLEDLEHAKARGASVIAEMLSYGAAADAYHMTQPIESGEGGIRSMKRALERGGLKPQDIDYINAHGTSTPSTTRWKTSAVKGVFGEYAINTCKLHQIHDRAPHRRGGFSGSRYLRAGDKRGHHSPTINLHTPTPTATWTMCRTRHARRRSISPCRTPSGSADTTTLIVGRYKEARVETVAAGASCPSSRPEPHQRHGYTRYSNSYSTTGGCHSPSRRRLLQRRQPLERRPVAAARYRKGRAAHPESAPQRRKDRSLRGFRCGRHQRHGATGQRAGTAGRGRHALTYAPFTGRPRPHSYALAELREHGREPGDHGRLRHHRHSAVQGNTHLALTARRPHHNRPPLPSGRIATGYSYS